MRQKGSPMPEQYSKWPEGGIAKAEDEALQ